MKQVVLQLFTRLLSRISQPTLPHVHVHRPVQVLPDSVYTDHCHHHHHHPSLYLLMSWVWWDWPLMWLTNHRPSVLWHCWLGHVTRKTVSEMTYNVSSGTLDSTIPYHHHHHQRHLSTIYAHLSTAKMWCWSGGRVILTQLSVLQYCVLSLKLKLLEIWRSSDRNKNAQFLDTIKYMSVRPCWLQA